MKERTYIAIDLKSFYASVECVERNLDPLDTNLVVADYTRTDKTICLAVSPSLKSFGVSSRPRLYEVVQKVKEINQKRLYTGRIHDFENTSYLASELNQNKKLALDYIVAPPQMKRYMEVSNQIYQIYLKYVAAEDMHIYSVDEVFIDATAYLNTYHMTARELTMTMIQDVLKTTGITATAGIGTNLYLAKVAMDIVAKHIPADKDGVRIAELDEMSYRKELWDHRPLTDFWRVGRGYQKKLEDNKLYTMGDIALCSLGKTEDFYNEDLLYKLFGINAELLIDHAWGYEPTTIAAIKVYKPQSSSMSSGQVLQKPYSFENARLVISEMSDLLSLDLVDKNVVCSQMVINIGYDIENLKDSTIEYSGEVKTDFYGRQIPKSAHGSISLGRYTASTMLINEAVLKLYDEIVNRKLLIRRIVVVAANVKPEKEAEKETIYHQVDLFSNYDEEEKKEKELEKKLAREKKEQKAVLEIRKKYGKNSLLKGKNLLENATAVTRNKQIGGHKA